MRLANYHVKVDEQLLENRNQGIWLPSLQTKDTAEIALWLRDHRETAPRRLLIDWPMPSLELNKHAYF